MACAAAGARAQDESPYDLPAATRPAAAEPVTVSDPGKQKVLVEMWTRGLLDQGETEWEPEDRRLLDRMHQAERLGAFDLIEDRAGTLRGFAVDAPGGGHQVLWLTKAGYTEYFFLKSQQARRFFERKGTDAKWVFRVRTIQRKKIFNVSGLLTPEGDELYTSILLRRPVEWLTPEGETRSNVRRKPAPPGSR